MYILTVELGNSEWVDRELLLDCALFSCDRFFNLLHKSMVNSGNSELSQKFTISKFHCTR